MSFRSETQKFIASPRFVLLVIILVIILVLGITKPSFFNGAFVIAPLLTSISIFTIVGLSQMVVLSVGHMNLAVGQMASFGAMFMGIAFDIWKLPLIPGVIIGLFAGAAVGALSGWIIAKTGVNSFIVTLAMSFALLGLVPTVYSWLSPGAAFTSKPEGMDVIGRGTFADFCVSGTCGTNAIPLMVIPASIVAILIGYLYYKTRLGREILMVGSNIEAARLSAISTNSRVILVHTLSGALAALAGFFLAASIGSFTPSIGDEFMLQSFVGPILGGTALAGGAVSVFGTVLGITLVLLIRKGLELFGLGIETLNVLLGVILLVALSTERLRKLGTPKRRQIIEKDSE